MPAVLWNSAEEIRPADKNTILPSADGRIFFMNFRRTVNIRRLIPNARKDTAERALPYIRQKHWTVT
jgi:hypothetical protein